MRKLSAEDRKRLLANPNVLRLTDRQVIFTPAFKMKAVELHSQDQSAKEIFQSHGIDPGLFSEEYCRKCIRNWRDKQKAQGRASLREDGRGVGSAGRKPKDLDSLSVEELKDLVVFQEELIDAIKKKKALIKKN